MMKTVKNKLIAIIPLLTILVSCGEIPTLSEGPRDNENIDTALSEAHFVNYMVQASQKNDVLGSYFTIATISPLDMSFKTKTKQLLFTTEHSSYYFDKVDNSYDVYYKDKLVSNSTYLGNSYLGRYNQTDVIENIPTISDIFEYYHVFNINSLAPEDFSYNHSLNGWYLLNEEAYPKTINEFFALDDTYTISRFNLQVSDNRVRSIEYELIDGLGVKIKNELFYTYPLDYLQEVQYSLINTVNVIKMAEPLNMKSMNAETSSEEPLTSEEPLISEEPPVSEPSTSEPVEEPNFVDKIEFAIYDDVKTFGTNRYTLNSIQLFEEYDYQTVNTPISEVTKANQETVTARSLTLNRRLTRGKRYLLRINIASSPDGASTDYYDYSWIH